jgi:hypothetical protein
MMLLKPKSKSKRPAVELKGTYNMNPTKMIMKQGSKEARAAHARSAGAGKTTRPIKGKTK